MADCGGIVNRLSCYPTGYPSGSYLSNYQVNQLLKSQKRVTPVTAPPPETTVTEIADTIVASETIVIEGGRGTLI
jgi:hypothetical protein